MTSSTTAKLGDSQGTQGSHTGPSAQAEVRQSQPKTCKPLSRVAKKITVVKAMEAPETVAPESLGSYKAGVLGCTGVFFGC